MFARMCAVSKAQISQKIKAGNLILNSGKKIDTDNPVNRAYLEKRQDKIRVGVTAASLEQKAAAMSSAQTVALDSAAAGMLSSASAVSLSAGDMLNLSVGQLVRRFGNVNGVEKYAKILRDLSSADERDQKRQERRGELVSRDFVSQRLFGFVNQILGQLLDVPESIVDELIATVNSGGEDMRGQLIHIVGDNLTKIISGAKEKILSELDGYRAKSSVGDITRELIEEQLDAIGNGAF